MTKKFIEAIQKGDTVQTGYFVIKKYKEAKTKTGKTYLDITFGDKTGEIKAKVWENALRNCDSVQEGNIVSVDGDVDEYNGSLQMSVSRMNIVDDFDPADFLPTSKHDLDTQVETLLMHINSIENEYLQQMFSNLVGDDQYLELLKNGFGAEKAHHAFLGGFLEHINEMITFIEPVCIAYPEINRDILLTGVIVHDIGKLEELEIATSISRTRKGHLWGHIVQGIERINRIIDTVDGFPDDLRDQVIHLIVSHHGKQEFGSPIKPMTIEAVALHYIDMLSSKLNMIRNMRGQTLNPLGFTDYSYLLEGRFYMGALENHMNAQKSQDIVEPEAFDEHDAESIVEPIGEYNPEFSDSVIQVEEEDDSANNLQIPF